MTQTSLLDTDLNSREQAEQLQPLASRMRPRDLSDYVGQHHLCGDDAVLARALLTGTAPSMILWGPPGTGKTTLARIVAEALNAHVDALSAVTAGVKDIRAAVERATQRRQQQQKTVLFVDEVHRFNKSQQDALLPHIEDGTFLFIGATTENPAFEVNNALLSRVRVFVLKSLTETDIVRVLMRAIDDRERGVRIDNLQLDDKVLPAMAAAAQGDARSALNMLECCVDWVAQDESPMLTIAVLEQVMQGGVRRFDKGGDVFYEQISALHKSVRGSAPDAALYWMGRMLDGGCDPLYIARRVVRMASEDIGLADPRALSMSLDAWQAVERLGAPEGLLALSQAVVYLAVAPKSNAIYTAHKAAMDAVRANGHLEVPLHLRNAPTALQQSMSYGEGYRYAHDSDEAYAAGEVYLPAELEGSRYYFPTDRGLEKKIGDKLKHLAALDDAAEASKEAAAHVRDKQERAK